MKHVAETSLAMTLANKLQCSVRQVYREFQTDLLTMDGTRKVLLVKVDRGPEKRPLVAYFGGLSLKWNGWATVEETERTVWSGRTELEQRLLAQKCELCGRTDQIEVHHIRKLANLTGTSRWEKVMASRRRKTLVVCQDCHHQIHAGLYDGPALA